MPGKYEPEEEKKVGLDDEEAEIRHRSRVSSLGIVMPTSESANIAANDDESKDNEESKGEDDVDNTETRKMTDTQMEQLSLKLRTITLKKWRIILPTKQCRRHLEVLVNCAC